MAETAGQSDESAPDLFSGAANRGGGGSGGQGRRGVTRQMETPVSGFGKGPVPYDSRKFKYDIYRAQATQASFAVTRDDRMSAEQAGDMLHNIHTKLGIDRVEEHKLRAFDDGLFLCHTLNSGSVLQPGRSKIFVDGQQFDAAEVNKFLGEDNRRFYRAFADEIKAVNRKVLKDYDPYNPVAVEHYGWIMQVALERGIHRFPHLAHDSADACVDITITERIAVANSKKLVISNSINAIDRANANSRTDSGRGYDSTNNAMQG